MIFSTSAELDTIVSVAELSSMLEAGVSSDALLFSGNGAEYPPPLLVLPQCVTNVASDEVEILFDVSIVVI